MTMTEASVSSSGSESDDNDDSSSLNEEEEALGPSVSSDETALKKKKVRYKLDPDEKRGLVASLEHIVTVGSAIKHNHERYQIWIDSGKDGHDIRGNETEEIISTVPLGKPKAGRASSEVRDSSSNNNNVIPPQSARMLHAEDVRIYGRNGLARMPWPSNNASAELRDDQQWDLEHGDLIQPLAFAEARLSEIPVPPSKRHRVDGPNLSIETTDCTMAQEEVPRAMLLRCWERAMQAASSVMHWDDPSSRKNVTDERFSPDDLETKCKHLGIELTDEKVCPNCGTCFDSVRRQREHFLGKSNQRGCCWHIIRQRQLETIGEVLVNGTIHSCQDLVRIVVSSSQQKEEEGRGRLANWHDVLHILDTETTSQCQRMHSSGHSDSNVGIVADTIHGPSQEAVVLNEQILEAVRIRLVERYADLPR